MEAVLLDLVQPAANSPYQAVAEPDEARPFADLLREEQRDFEEPADAAPGDGRTSRSEPDRRQGSDDIAEAPNEEISDPGAPATQDGVAADGTQVQGEHVQGESQTSESPIGNTITLMTDEAEGGGATLLARNGVAPVAAPTLPPQTHRPEALSPQLPSQAVPPQAVPPQAVPPQAVLPQAVPPQAVPPQALPAEPALQNMERLQMARPGPPLRPTPNGAQIAFDPAQSSGDGASRGGPAAATKGLNVAARVVVTEASLISLPKASLGGAASIAAETTAQQPAAKPLALGLTNAPTVVDSTLVASTPNAKTPITAEGTLTNPANGKPSALAESLAATTSSDRAVVSRGLTPAQHAIEGAKAQAQPKGEVLAKAPSPATPLLANTSQPTGVTPSGDPAAAFGLSVREAVSTEMGSVQGRPAGMTPGSPAEQVAIQIYKAASGGSDRIRIKLYPAELGRIDVKLQFAGDGAVKVVVTAEKSDTLDLLLRDSRTLERALQDAGLKTDSHSLNFNLRGEGQRDHAGGREAVQDGDPRHASGESEGELDHDQVTHRRRHDGALDMSV